MDKVLNEIMNMNDVLENIEIHPCESKISTNPGSVLFSHLEGSSTAVLFYDPAVHVGGMLHFLLPSPPDAASASRPFQYAETGIEKTLFSMLENGAEWDRLVIKLCGAMITEKNAEQDAVSRQNILAARKMFWRLGLFIHSQDIGGNQPRQLCFNIADGTVTVQLGSINKRI